MALLGPAQRRFVGTLAHLTGLDPRVVGAWALAEESGSAARNYEGRSYHNFLNIARTDSGDAHGAHSNVWANPESAAQATAEWLQGRGQIAKEYGKPAGGIMRILGAKGPAAQINAIATSGWASSGYNGGSSLRSLFGELGGEHIPTGPSTASVGASAGSEPSQATAGASGGPQALIQALLAQSQQTVAPEGGSIPKPAAFPGTTLPNGGSLGGSAPVQTGQAKEAQALLAQALGSQGQSQEPQGAPTGQPSETETGAPEVGSSGYVNPYKGFTKGRVDQGIDFSGRPGQAIRAVGNGRVLPTAANWFKGQPYVSYELTDGPQRGKVVYVAEQIAPNVRPGQRIRAGQTIGRYASSGTALETGFGTRSPGQTLAKATSGYSEGQVTPAGRAFERFLRGLG